MLYWKTFVLMCVTVWIFTLADVSAIVLATCHIFSFNAVQWIIVSIILAVSAMASFVCYTMFEEEVKERRRKRDNRRNFK